MLDTYPQPFFMRVFESRTWWRLNSTQSLSQSSLTRGNSVFNAYSLGASNFRYSPLLPLFKMNFILAYFVSLAFQY